MSKTRLADELEAGPVLTVLAPDLEDDRLLRPWEEGVVSEAHGDGAPERALVRARRRLRRPRIDEPRRGAAVRVPCGQERRHPRQARRWSGSKRVSPGAPRRYASVECPGDEILRHAACHRRWAGFTRASPSTCTSPPERRGNPGPPDQCGRARVGVVDGVEHATSAEGAIAGRRRESRPRRPCP